MIDIHCHILPGIDDGSISLTESLLMAQTATANGTKKIVATPHYCNEFQNPEPISKEDVRRSFNELKNFLKMSKSPIELYMGAEQFGINNIASLIEDDELITINDSRYLLLEFNLNDDFDRAKYVLSQLEDYDVVPIIAHPERYNFIHEKPGRIFYFLQNGCLLQVNKGSVSGRFGEEEERISHWILRERMAHFVASDSHGPYQRTGDMSDAFHYALYNCGEKYTHDIFEGNAQKVLDDEPVE